MADHLLTLRATSVSSALLPRLPVAARAATLHSAFDRALNVSLGQGFLLTLAREDAGNLPGGVLLSGADWSTLVARRPVPGERLALSRLSLQIPGRELGIDLGPAQLWHPCLALEGLAGPAELGARLSAAATHFLREGHSLIPGVVPGAAPPDGQGGGPGFSAQLGSRAGALLAPLFGGDPRGVHEAVGDLVGFGPGLTPSGDDLLVGALLALRLLAPHHSPAQPAFELLAGAVYAQAGRTTAVGESYLRYAATGAFAELPVAFGRGLLGGGGSWGAAARGLCRFGASSGADLASGLMLIAGRTMELR